MIKDLFTPQEVSKFFKKLGVALLILALIIGVGVGITYYYKRAITSAEARGKKAGIAEMTLKFEKEAKEQKEQFDKVINDTNSLLEMKTQELENEKIKSSIALADLERSNERLQQTIRRGKESARAITTSSTRTSHEPVNVAVWSAFGECVSEYKSLGEDAEQRNHREKEWQVYGQAINHYRDGLAKVNESNK